MKDHIKFYETMGPIERELRDYDLEKPWLWIESSDIFSWEAFRVMAAAAFSLGLDGHSCKAVEGHLLDVLSEAIEAASALGL